jgi:hypothetical protein
MAMGIKLPLDAGFAYDHECLFLNELLLFVLSWTMHIIPYMGGLDYLRQHLLQFESHL